jgi:hypothetical protein
VGEKRNRHRRRKRKKKKEKEKKREQVEPSAEQVTHQTRRDTDTDYLGREKRKSK